MVRDQTGLDARDPAGDPAVSRRGDRGQPREEMPVNETLELAAQPRAGDRRRARRRDASTGSLPELFGRGEEAGVRARCGTTGSPSPEDALSEAVGTPVRPDPRRRPTSPVTLAPHPAASTSAGCAEELPPGTPLLYVPYLFSKQPRRRATRQVAEHLGRGAGRTDGRAAQARLDLERLLAAKEIVIQLRLRRRGARPPPRRAVAAMAAVHHGGKVLVLTVDPAEAARQRASASRRFGNVETRVPQRGVRRRPASSPGASCGRRCSTPSRSWDDLVRRHAPDPATRRHPRQPALQEHHRALRAEPRLHRDGAALRDPRPGRVRPHRRRHAAHAERHRLPRGARADGRLLLEPRCCAGSPCPPAAAC